MLQLDELANELDELERREDSEDEDDRLDDDEVDRLEMLRSIERDLGSSLSNYARNESTAFTESEFVDQMEEDAYDFGLIERNSTIARYVNWKDYADDCKADYNEFEYEGETYLVRAY